MGVVRNSNHKSCANLMTHEQTKHLCNIFASCTCASKKSTRICQSPGLQRTRTQKQHEHSRKSKQNNLFVGNTVSYKGYDTDEQFKIHV